MISNVRSDVTAPPVCAVLLILVYWLHAHVNAQSFLCGYTAVIIAVIRGC